MRTVKLEDMKRMGIDIKAVLCPTTFIAARLTIPARERLEAAGAKLSPASGNLAATHYKVVLPVDMPKGLLAMAIMQQVGVGIRLTEEPPYPNEFDIDFWHQADLTPCPKCGKALIWWEAGYVPGYRVCAGKKHHHWLVK